MLIGLIWVTANIHKISTLRCLLKYKVEKECYGQGSIYYNFLFIVTYTHHACACFHKRFYNTEFCGSHFNYTELTHNFVKDTLWKGNKAHNLSSSTLVKYNICNLYKSAKYLVAKLCPWESFTWTISNDPGCLSRDVMVPTLPKLCPPVTMTRLPIANNSCHTDTDTNNFKYSCYLYNMYSSYGRNYTTKKRFYYRLRFLPYQALASKA